MIRVLMISASATYGGGPQHIYDLAKLLRKQVCVDIACPRQDPFYTRFAQVIAGEICEIPERKFTISSSLRLMAFVRKKKVSLLHSHGKGAGTYGRFISLFSKLPLIHTTHGIHVDHYCKLMRLVYLSYERLTGWINLKTIFVSRSEFECALRLGISSKAKSCVICNGVASQKKTDWYQNTRKKTRRQLGIKKHNVLVVTLSRFNYPKNMLEMLSVAQKTPQVKFLLLGNGPDFAQVKNIVTKQAIDNISLQGFVNNPLDYLAAADLYISTSRWEGLPLGILQAMSVSLPVVASNVSGNRDAVIDGKTGFLYTPGNIDEAVKYVKILSRDVKKRKKLGKQGKKRQELYFSLSQMAKETYQVYKSTLR